MSLKSRPPADRSPSLRLILVFSPLAARPDDSNALARHPEVLVDLRALRCPHFHTPGNLSLVSRAGRPMCHGRRTCPISENRPERILRGIARTSTPCCIGSNRVDNQRNTTENHRESPLFGALSRHSLAEASRPRSQAPPVLRCVQSPTGQGGGLALLVIFRSQTAAGCSSNIFRTADRSSFPFPLLGSVGTTRIRCGSIQAGSTDWSSSRIPISSISPVVVTIAIN